MPAAILKLNEALAIADTRFHPQKSNSLQLVLVTNGNGNGNGTI